MVELVRQFGSRVDDETLDLVTVALLEDRVRAPRAVDRTVDEVFSGFAFPKLIDDFFDVLRPFLAADQRGVRRVHDDGVLEADGRHEPFLREYNGIAAPDVDNVAGYDVP